MPENKDILDNKYQTLPRGFFARNALIVARETIGKHLVRRFDDGMIAVGKIVETEAYLQDDPACHAFRGKTARNKTLFGIAGHAYVHINYGIHLCLNLVTGDDNCAEGVLIRAVEPIVGIEKLWATYGTQPTGTSDYRIGAGPGRVGKAFGLSLSHDGLDLCNNNSPFRIADGNAVPDSDIVIATRIGITKGADYPWRFYLRGSRWVSRR